MPQLNIHLTDEFSQQLEQFMRLRSLKTKSSAVREAVRSALKHELEQRERADFESWIGLATRSPINTKPQFNSDDDLWS